MDVRGFEPLPPDLAKQVLREFRTQPILIRLNAKESFNARFGQDIDSGEQADQ